LTFHAPVFFHVYHERDELDDEGENCRTSMHTGKRNNSLYWRWLVNLVLPKYRIFIAHYQRPWRSLS